MITISTNAGMVTAVMPDGVQYSAKPVDDTFPNWRRVIPTEVSGEHAEYNLDYINSAIEAWRIYNNFSKKQIVAIARNGTGAAGIFDNGFCAILMPWRTEPITSGMGTVSGALTVKPKPMAA